MINSDIFLSRILVAPPGLKRYHRANSTRDVIIVSDLFGSYDDLTIYNNLLYEVQNSGVPQVCLVNIRKVVWFNLKSRSNCGSPGMGTLTSLLTTSAIGRSTAQPSPWFLIGSDITLTWTSKQPGSIGKYSMVVRCWTVCCQMHAMLFVQVQRYQRMETISSWCCCNEG